MVDSKSRSTCYPTLLMLSTSLIVAILYTYKPFNCMQVFASPTRNWSLYVQDLRHKVVITHCGRLKIRLTSTEYFVSRLAVRNSANIVKLLCIFQDMIHPRISLFICMDIAAGPDVIIKTFPQRLSPKLMVENLHTVSPPSPNLSPRNHLGIRRSGPELRFTVSRKQGIVPFNCNERRTEVGILGSFENENCYNYSKSKSVNSGPNLNTLRIPVRTTTRKNHIKHPIRTRNILNCTTIHTNTLPSLPYPTPVVTTRPSLRRIKLAHLNARSLKNRMNFMQVTEFAHQHDIGILTVSET